MGREGEAGGHWVYQPLPAALESNVGLLKYRHWRETISELCAASRPASPCSLTPRLLECG